MSGTAPTLGQEPTAPHRLGLGPPLRRQPGTADVQRSVAPEAPGPLTRVRPGSPARGWAQRSPEPGSADAGRSLGDPHKAAEWVTVSPSSIQLSRRAPSVQRVPEHGTSELASPLPGDHPPLPVVSPHASPQEAPTAWGHSGEPADETVSEAMATGHVVTEVAATPSVVNMPTLPEGIALAGHSVFPDLPPAAPLLAARPLTPVSLQRAAAPRAPEQGGSHGWVRRQVRRDVPVRPVQRAWARAGASTPVRTTQLADRQATGRAPVRGAPSPYDEDQPGELTAWQPLSVSPLQRAESPTPPTPRLPLAAGTARPPTIAAASDPAAAALSTGLATVDADGAIVFPGLAGAVLSGGTQLAVQRAGSDAALIAPVAVQAGADAVPGPDATPSGAPSTGPGAAPAAAGTADLDELAKRLYDRIRVRLKAELRLDRERAGLMTELGR